MGVKIGISLSNGEEIDHQITDKLEKMRKLRKKLSRQVKDSNGYLRTLDQIKREYQKISDKKDDIANQLVSRLTADSVVFSRMSPCHRGRARSLRRMVRRSCIMVFWGG